MTARSYRKKLAVQADPPQQADIVRFVDWDEAVAVALANPGTWYMVASDTFSPGQKTYLQTKYGLECQIRTVGGPGSAALWFRAPEVAS